MSAQATGAVEIELKFQVPAAARAALHRAVATASARTTPLQALYADTADDRLAHAAMALRLRKEGDRWVQTLKGRGDGLLQRLEHELPLPDQPGEPQLDPARHAGTAAGARLAELLADGAVLQTVYRTDILRTHRLVRSGGATIEIAFDEGCILAAGQTLAVCEIEFELKSGPPQALLALAARWVQRHGLWLDVRTKSERGHRLARGLDVVPAVRATPLALTAAASPAQALSAAVQSCLAQMLPNAAELAGGHGQPEHVHQLRVAIRRLRSVLKLLHGWSAEPEAALALEGQLRGPFTRLGAARDQQALAASLGPALAAAGGPPIDWPQPAAEDPGAIVRESDFTLAVLQALQLTLPGEEGEEGAAPPPLRQAARDVLKPAFRRALAGAKGFADAEVEHQHRTRKRLKRFRYVAESLQALFPGKPARRALAALRLTLEALGAYNDLLVAQDHFAAVVATDPRAWFALGWLAARRDVLLQEAARSLRELDDAPRFWQR